MPSSTRPLPEGTVTFLRSDIEGSMRLARALGARYDDLNEEHQALVRACLAAHGGHEVRTEGDAFFVVFEDALAAARAAVDIERALAAHDWPEGAEVRVRIGLHAGSARLSGDDYGGFEVSRAARIAGAGWGGQIVLSDPVRALLGTDLPAGWAIRDLGRHRLKDVVEPEHLFQLEATGLRTAFPPLRGSVGRTDGLPARLTSFVGRDDDLEALERLIERARLLTLTGPGGTGKSSLAVELARRVSGRFAEGAWFVDLQAVTDPGLVSAEVARALGLFDGTSGSAAERLGPYVADREMLLVLDTFEQLVEGAGQVTRLLTAGPALRIVVTSRAALHVSGEQEYPVRPLGFETGGGGRDGGDGGDGGGADGERPDREPEAVLLFVERARHARPDLALGPAERSTVARICAEVDGLPLAIELAAARVSSLPLGLIEERLRARLPLPGSGPRDLPDRQRTLERTIEWSHDLLAPPVRGVLARAAVFEESFDLEQAEPVCGPNDTSALDVLDGLVALVDQSLLRRASDGSAGARFSMLETIRGFGLARLAAAAEAESVRERHARAYLALAEAAAPHMQAKDQLRWLDRLRADHANLRGALAWSVTTGRTELALDLSGALWRFWLLTGRAIEGRALAESALSMPGADAPTPSRLRALDAAGGLAYWMADTPSADACYREQLEIARQLGDPADEALAAFNLSHTRGILDDTQGGREALDLARRLYADLGDARRLARADVGTAMLAYMSDPSEARPVMEAMLRRFEALEDEPYVALACGMLSWACLREGDIVTGLRYGQRAIRTSHALGDLPSTTVSLQAAAVFLLILGHAEVSGMLLGAFDALCELYGVRPPAALEWLIRTADPAARTLDILGPERYAAAYARGSRMSLDDAVDLVEEAAAAPAERSAG